MPVPIICPHCDAKGSAPDKSLGHHCRCPKCGNKVPVPRLAKVTQATDDDVRQKPLVVQAADDEAQNLAPARRRPIKRQLEKEEDWGVVPSLIGRGRNRKLERRKSEDEDIGFCCPFCQTHRPPEVNSKISAAGWVIFVVLLICCFPACFIGLFIKEDYRVCSQCGIRLG
jgi:hypothetical protein